MKTNKQLRTQLRLTKNQAKAIQIVAQHELRTSEAMDLIDAEMELQCLRNVDLEKSMDILFGLAESKHLRIVDLHADDEFNSEFKVSCHPKILAYMRVGVPGYLDDFAKSEDHDAVAAIAEFLEHVRSQRKSFFFIEEVAEFPKQMQELHQLICREEIFITFGGKEDNECALLASLACGQYSLDRRSIDCTQWMKIIQPNLTLRSALRNRWTTDHPLFVDGWLIAEDTDAEGRVLQATPSGVARELLDLDRQLAPTKPASDLFEVVAAAKIAEADLVYPENETATVAEWKQLLTSDALDRHVADASVRPIQKRFTFLLDGPSGSGKTALVYELARLSNRPLLRIKMESLRSKYVGESEALVARLFRDLRAFTRESSSLPVILLDECDGLLGNRAHTSNYSHNVETNIITIILQALDRFEGILCCTTNHAESLDAAFLRRFAFQLTLPAPDAKTRFHILTRYFPTLSAEDCKALSHEQVFTAAQAEQAANQIALLNVVGTAVRSDAEAIRSRLRSVARHSRDAQLGTGKIGYLGQVPKRA